MSERLRHFCWLALLAVGPGSGSLQVTDLRASELSTLSGYVFVDQNFDGLRDPAIEWVFPEIELWLTQLGDSTAPLTALTGADGYYEFSGLDAGTYRLIQPTIPGGYLTAQASVGQLYDAVTGDQATTFPGYVVNRDQETGTAPQVADIELPGTATRGVNYDFGQIWTGKAWYLTGDGSTNPPGTNPPAGVPEPSTVVLTVVAAILWISWVGVGRARRS